MEHGVKEWQRNGGRGETQKYENEEEIGRQITIDCMVALLCKVWTRRRSEGREGISRCHLDGGRRDRLGFQYSSFRWWISSLLWRGFGFFFEVDRITADCTCRWLNVVMCSVEQADKVSLFDCSFVIDLFVTELWTAYRAVILSHWEPG